MSCSENAQRRVDTLGEPPLVAAERGTRQVFFAIVATSAVLVAVFAPLLFVGGYVGSLFVELAVTIAGVVVISAFAVALAVADDVFEAHQAGEDEHAARRASSMARWTACARPIARRSKRR